MRGLGLCVRGNREALLESAKRNLTERGYAHITARDLAGGAGTRLAAIGYHFGSTDALPNDARYELRREGGDQLDRALTACRARAGWGRGCPCAAGTRPGTAKARGGPPEACLCPHLRAQTPGPGGAAASRARPLGSAGLAPRK